MSAPAFSRRLVIAGAAASILCPFRASGAVRPPSRILGIGGVVTETIFALGGGKRMIGRDTSSIFPDAALSLPDVGYMRMLAAEGLIAMAPDLIVAIEGSGPPPTLRLIADSGIEFRLIPDGFDRAAIGRKIAAIGEAIGLADAGADLAARAMAAHEAAVADLSGRTSARPRALFCLSASGGRLMVAGTGTAADALIRDAGGINVMGDFSGYKPAGDEATIAARPEIVLLMQRPDGMAKSHVAELPSLAGSPAVRNGAIHDIDGLKCLGYGPRAGEAVREVAALFARAERKDD